MFDVTFGCFPQMWKVAMTMVFYSLDIHDYYIPICLIPARFTQLEIN